MKRAEGDKQNRVSSSFPPANARDPLSRDSSAAADSQSEAERNGTAPPGDWLLRDGAAAWERRKRRWRRWRRPVAALLLVLLYLTLVLLLLASFSALPQQQRRWVCSRKQS